MWNLISFLAKNYFFFLFLLLEIICFIFIYNYSYYQRSVVVHTTNSVTGSLNNTYTEITEYLRLKEVNEELAQENALLRSVLVPDTTSVNQEFLLKADTAFHYTAAKVISNTINKRNNYLMLNRGSAHGIQKDMGVISSLGVVGIIVDVSENFSSAMSVLHKDARISGKILKNGQLVNVSWGGIDYMRGLIQEIPTHITLQKGDTVITSGYSHIFPEGVVIGTVESFDVGGGQLFNQGTIRFSIDFNRLGYVYIIHNQYRKEQTNLIE